MKYFFLRQISVQMQQANFIEVLSVDIEIKYLEEYTRIQFLLGSLFTQCNSQMKKNVYYLSFVIRTLFSAI